MENAIKSPYIGEIVHYHPEKDDSISRLNGVTTCAAIIVNIHGDPSEGNVNLKIFNDGEAFTRKTSVLRRATDEDHSWSSIGAEVEAPAETEPEEVPDAPPVKESAEEVAEPTGDAAVPAPEQGNPPENGQDEAEPSDEAAGDQPSVTEDAGPVADPATEGGPTSINEEESQDRPSVPDTGASEKAPVVEDQDAPPAETSPEPEEEKSDADVLDKATGNAPKEEAPAEGDAPKESKPEDEAPFPG